LMPMLFNFSAMEGFIDRVIEMIISLTF